MVTYKLVFPIFVEKEMVKKIKLVGCSGNNLKNINIEFPLGVMIAITGVSGSGKSSLINETLYPAISNHLYNSFKIPLPYQSISGLENIDKIVDVTKVLLEGLQEAILLPTVEFLVKSEIYLQKPQKHKLEVINQADSALM